MALESQPGRESYFFGKGYRDLGNTIKGAFYLNWQHVKEYFKRFCDASGMGKLFNFAICASLLVFGTLWTLSISFLHVSILFLFFLFVYVGFSVVWLIDRCYILLHHISTACPNPDCQEHYRIPAYVCPNPDCMVVHTDLTPGRWGILHRECICGTMLPTTFLNGRERLMAICPECWKHRQDDHGDPLVTPIVEGGRSVQISIPIIGNKTVGKTCYINYAVTCMREMIAPEHGWTFEFEDESDEHRYSAAMQCLGSGDVPATTQDHRLTAYKFLLKGSAWKIPKQIYMYDVAGEIFSDAFEVGSQQAYSYSNGFLILLDPFSLDDFAMEQEASVVDACRASVGNVNDMLDALLINLEKMYNLRTKGAVNTHVAVVINKCDAGGLEERIGDSAVDTYLTDHPECKTRVDAQNRVCVAFLKQYGAANFVSTMQNKFRDVQYFTCSVLGHEPNGHAFAPQRVEEPMMWLLNQADSTIK